MAGSQVESSPTTEEKRSEAYTTKLQSPEVYGNLDETVDEPLKYVIFVNLDVQLDLGDPNNHTLGHPHPSNPQRLHST